MKGSFFKLFMLRGMINAFIALDVALSSVPEESYSELPPGVSPPRPEPNTPTHAQLLSTLEVIQDAVDKLPQGRPSFLPTAPPPPTPTNSDLPPPCPNAYRSDVVPSDVMVDIPQGFPGEQPRTSDLLFPRQEAPTPLPPAAARTAFSSRIQLPPGSSVFHPTFRRPAAAAPSAHAAPIPQQPASGYVHTTSTLSPLPPGSSVLHPPAATVSSSAHAAPIPQPPASGHVTPTPQLPAATINKRKRKAEGDAEGGPSKKEVRTSAPPKPRIRPLELRIRPARSVPLHLRIRPARQ